MGKPVIIVGSSARAAAQSAVRAGFEPWCIDRRGDRDLRQTPGVTVRTLEAKDYPRGILKLLDEAPADAKVLLSGGMDGEHELLKAIGFEHAFVTSPPEAVRKVRWPTALATIPTTPGLRHCKTLTSIGFLRRLWRLAFGSFGKTKYLLKPRASYGGQDISWWTPGRSIPASHYLQEYVRGMPISAVYHCDGWSSILLGATEQLIGETCFGASTFAYCGSIGPVYLTERAREALSHLGVVPDPAVRPARRIWRRPGHGLQGRPLANRSQPALHRQRRIDRADHRCPRNHPHRRLAQGKKAAPGHARQGHCLRQTILPDPRPVCLAWPRSDRRRPRTRPNRSQGAAICTLFTAAHSRDECFNKLKAMAQQVYNAVPAAS